MSYDFLAGHECPKCGRGVLGGKLCPFCQAKEPKGLDKYTQGGKHKK